MQINLLTFDLETSGTLPEYALQSWRAPHDAWITSLVWMHDGVTHGGLNPTKADLLDMLVYAQENDCTIAGWNVQFDVQWLIAYGLEEEVFRCKFIDGMLLWRHLTIEPEYDATGLKRKSYGLKAAVAEFMPAFADYEEDIDFHDPSPEARAKLHEYNINDVKFTASLTKQFHTQLSKKQRKAAAIEAECIPLIAAANYHGMVVDVPAVEALCAKLEQTAEQKLAELAPHGVTEEIIRSPAKLSKLLFEDWGLPRQGLTPTGDPSTDKSALHELSLIDPRAKTLREYREALNNKTKFAEVILESATYNGDNTTHPQAIIFGTYSGRLTYDSKQGRGKGLRQTGFAIHQMKRGAEYRNAIKAPDGYTLLEFDAAGQEFRWMAIASNDPNMLKLCMPGEDAHAFMGNKINPSADDKKAARQLGKIANLSLGYRTSAKKLRTVARVQYGLPMEQPEADKIHAAYQDAYSQVPVFWKSQIAKVKQLGYVETYAGRRVRVDGDWNGDHAWSMGSTAINYRIQGSGSDQKYLALAVLKPYLREIGARFAWDLHDGIYLYVPNARVKEAAAQIKLLLDNLPYETAWGFKPTIPLPWDCKIGASWGDLKEYKINEADAPDQEGVSLSINPALRSDGEDRECLGDLTQTNKPSTNLVQVDFRTPREAALEIALKFAAAGIKTFPCQADKKPAPGFTDWEGRASADPDQLRQWFLTDYRDTAAMVGMPCGPNNLVAIDPDRPKPEKGKTADGLVLFKNLIHELSINLAGVPIIKSPSGGQHYIFAQPHDARFGCQTGSLPDNVDVKGDGGYLIASGSRRADGLAYEQMPGTPSLLESFLAHTIPPMPIELRNIIGTKKEKASSSSDAERMDWHLLAEALAPMNIPNDATFDSRDEWVTMAHAIYGASAGQDWGRKEWLAWNARRQQSQGEPERVWDTIKPADVRSGAGYIKSQLFTRSRTELLERIANAEAGFVFTKVDGAEGQSDDPKPDELTGPSPFKRISAWDMPPRQFVYKKHYIRKFISASIAPGGVGKSTVAIAEAVAMATGKDLLGHTVTEPLKVWYWNGEDPFDELQRRFLAVIQHFGLTNADLELLEKNLFFDSGRNMEIKIAFQEKNGAKIAAPVANKLKQWIEENKIDVLIVDPFVSSHSVSENDNNAIDVVAKAWAKIADVTNSAIDLVHHVRKTNGMEATVEDARGASALLAAVRSARVFNAMSGDEAARAGVHNPKLYFKEDNGKANLAPAAAAQWYKIAGVDLPNGDSVATVDIWQWPNIHDQVTEEDLVEIQKRCKETEPSESVQAADWVGHVVADVMGLNAGDKADKARIKELLKAWLKEGNLCVKTAWNARQGKPKKVISSHA